MITHSSSTDIQTWTKQPHILGLNESVSDGSSMAVAPLTSARQSIDLSATDSGLPDIEYAHKRPRLDTNVTGFGSDGRTPSKSAEARSALLTGSAARLTAVSGRSRPAYSFQELVADTYGGNVFSGNVTPGSQPQKPPSPPPFPVRPWIHAPPYNKSQIETTGLPEDVHAREVQTVPYHPETPATAPCLSKEKVADYSPWSRLGDHPEDKLTEFAVKQGYFDKAQGPGNSDVQSHTSKLSSQLKNRSGLQLLSSVFAAAMEKRQIYDKISSTSTFKPPPRVTLTDNKRETWLRDLANPSVPLRRLSRTIPHGIRGKLLLDQCLGKGVPIGRAVWLAKCVGANEIRAFKRKGTSGSLSQGLETKWVYEWTVSVQQFIEGVIAVCGSKDWRDKMTYAVRLAARLFFELLLDQDSYLDWYLTSMENSTLDVFPVWLAMLSIYWQSLVRFRKRGRRLAEALLEKLREAVLSESKAHLQPLIDRVSVLVRKLYRDHSPCLILPRTWDRYKDIIISSSLTPDDSKEKAIIQSLVLRNTRVQKPRADYPATHSSQKRIIEFLDSSRDTHDVCGLSNTCLALVRDREELISVLLKWAASPFRHGLVRVYLAVRLFRKWKRSGMDIDSFIFPFLTQISTEHDVSSMKNIYHIIVELIRSQTFSVGRYLQWLVARGVIEQYRQEHMTKFPPAFVPADIDLLSHIPVARLPRHLRNLRETLMVRAGLPSEAGLLDSLKVDLRQQLPALLGKDNFGDQNMILHVDQSKITWSIKADISQWIRAAVSEHYETASVYRRKEDYDSPIEVSSLTQEEFLIIRSTLERFGDISMLADVLIDASNSDDIRLLTCAVDTLNLHFRCFAVIGALGDLFRNFYEAFLRVRNSTQPLYDLAYSLTEIGHRLPNETNPLIVLQQELSRGDRNLALAACSPVSDQVAETLDDANPSFNEDMDQFLSSGNIMDETTMIVVFQKLIQQLVLYNEKNASMPGTVCRHLVQLRSFNSKHFDLLLVQWLDAILKSTSRPRLSQILRPLVGIGCVTLSGFVILMKKLLQPKSFHVEMSELPELLADFLELFVPVDYAEPLCDFLSYRFRIAQEEFLHGNPHEVLDIIQDIASHLTHAAAEDSLNSEHPWATYMSLLLREIVVRHPEDAILDSIRRLMKNFSSFSTVAEKSLDMLLHDNNERDLDFLSETAIVINKANYLSLPLCQMKMQILLNEKGDDDNIKNSIVDLMYKSAVADVRAGRTCWLDFMSTIDREVVEQIRQRAERDFFFVAQSDSVLEKDSGNETLDLRENASIYLAIIDGLAFSISEEGVASMAPLLVEKMNMVLQKLFAMNVNMRNWSELRTHPSPEAITGSLSAYEENFVFWFTAMLQMIRIHRAAFDLPSSPTPRPSAYADLSRLLIIICCLALSRTPLGLTVQPRLDLSASSFLLESAQEVREGNTIQTYALDTASSLVDSLPDFARQQCANFIRERFPPTLNIQNDPRLQYLFGPVAESSAVGVAGSVSVSSPASTGQTATLTPSANPSTATTTSAAINIGGIPIEDPSAISNRLRIQSRGRVVGTYPLRPWEMLEEAAPVVGSNDTAIDLNLFGTRKVRDY